MQLLSLREFKLVIDDQLADIFTHKRVDIAHLSTNTVIEQGFAQAERVTLSGGKRFRPYAAYLGYLTAGGQNMSAVLPLGVGVELLHGFAMIHDDIMDRSPLRHGQMTLHAMYQESMDAFTAQSPTKMA